ncbi:MAG: LamG-like jellyroll fold domain-containing protein [Planctomycetota bacterium]
MNNRLMLCCFVGALLVGLVATDRASAQLLTTPQPGEIYREYTRVISGGNLWRVTDPNSTFVGSPTNSPSTFLPNPQISLSVGTLAGATRAEALIDVWGGHVGTINKRMRFNGNSWLTIPDILNTPGAPECYTHQPNVCVNIPLSHLTTGTNIFEGTSGGQTCFSFNWGQWGWYMLTLRVYYSSSQPHATGSITSHSSGGTIGDFATVSATASGGGGISRVEFFAYYDGYDTDGDGHYQQYHHAYHHEAGDSTAVTRQHVGTVSTAPYQVTWNTDLVPDQAPGSVKLIARILDNNGVWFVTNEITGLTLQRFGTSVKLYKPFNVPQKHWVRDGQTQSSNVSIPGTDILANAQYAKLLVHTWNGIDGQNSGAHWTRVNGWTAPLYGANHRYSYDVIDVPTGQLQTGTNTISFYSQSTHHGIEIMWPGPAILVRYDVVTGPPPAAPTGLTASPLSENEIMVSWNANSEPDLASYTLHRSTTSGFTPNGTNLVASGLTGTSTVDNGLQRSVTYYYKLKAVNTGGGESSPSAQASSTTLADLVPPSIASIAATSAVSVQLTFSEDVSTATAQNPAHYALAQGPTGIAILSATLSGDQRTVILATATLPEGVLLTLDVNGVQDLAPVPNSANDSATLQFDDLLLAHWNFDQGTGNTAVDATGNGHNGTVLGPTWNPNTPDGSAFALQFDGTGDFVDISPMDASGGALTVAAWFNPATFTVTDGRIISKADGTPDANHIYMISTVLSGSDYRLRARVNTGATTTLFASSGNLQLNTWTHAAMTYDGGMLRLYKDGVEVGSVAASGTIPAAPLMDAAIGNQPIGAGDRPFDGSIDDVRIYGRALTAAEIMALATPPSCFPPIARTGPMTSAPCVGGSLAVTSDFSGTEPLSYQWRKDGVPISGATSAILNIAAMTAADVGDYDVVATNACGTATSTTATVTIGQLPVVTADPIAQTVCVGDPVLLSVTATGDALTYQWFQDGAAVAGATAATLDLGNVTAGAAGNYYATVTNTCGTATSTTATVTVNAPAMIGTQPASATVCATEMVVLTTTAAGTPPLTYQWFLAGAPIPGATTDTLTLASVDAADAGDYTVTVSNICGFDLSDAATLSLLPMVDCDCNSNGVIDSVEIAQGQQADCNNNGIPDSCDIAGGTSVDSDNNAIPDECQAGFVRGDCDVSGGINLVDAVFLLQFLFASGPLSTCSDACDANDDGMLDLTDPISVLCALFCVPAQGLPAPGVGCGPDPSSGDTLDCISYICP